MHLVDTLKIEEIYKLYKKYYILTHLLKFINIIKMSKNNKILMSFEKFFAF